MESIFQQNVIDVHQYRVIEINTYVYKQFLFEHVLLYIHVY